MIAVAYYTPGPYQTEAQRLRQSLIDYEVIFDIECLPDRGSWQANTQQKANFLHDKADFYFGRRLLYLDADAIVHSCLDQMDAWDCDLAVHRRESGELLSGTILFRANEKVCRLFDNWIDWNRRRPDAWDQVNLDTALAEAGNGLSIKALPPEFCFITGVYHSAYPNLQPIIEHMQASRKYRNG